MEGCHLVTDVGLRGIYRGGADKAKQRQTVNSWVRSILEVEGLIRYGDRWDTLVLLPRFMYAQPSAINTLVEKHSKFPFTLDK